MLPRQAITTDWLIVIAYLAQFPGNFEHLADSYNTIHSNGGTQTIVSLNPYFIIEKHNFEISVI